MGQYEYEEKVENTDGRPADPALTTVVMCENSANVGQIQHL